MELQLEPELEARLARVAEETQVTSSFLAHEAVARFVEDREDYLSGIRAISAMKYVISLEEMERRASVAD